MSVGQEEFAEWWDAQSRAELANMSQGELIALLMAKPGAEFDRTLVEQFVSEQREREWNVRKPRQRSEWPWALAAYFRDELPKGKFKELARLVDGLPTKQSEETLALSDDRYQVYVDHDDNIVCSYTDGPNKTVEQSMSRSTFEQNYLRKVPKR